MVRDVPAEVDPRAAVLIPLLRDAEAHVVASAVQALGYLRIQAATPEIVEILRKGEPWQRSIAAKSLGSIGDRRAVVPLRKAQSDRDETVRSDARHALEAILSGRVLAEVEKFDVLPDI
jgi:HEAT repeat protein